MTQPDRMLHILRESEVEEYTKVNLLNYPAIICDGSSTDQPFITGVTMEVAEHFNIGQNLALFSNEVGNAAHLAQRYGVAANAFEISFRREILDNPASGAAKIFAGNFLSQIDQHLALFDDKDSDSKHRIAGWLRDRWFTLVKADQLLITPEDPNYCIHGQIRNVLLRGILFSS